MNWAIRILGYLVAGLVWGLVLPFLWDLVIHVYLPFLPLLLAVGAVTALRERYEAS